MNEERDLLVLLRAADQELSRATLSSEAKARIAGDLAAAASRAPPRRSAVWPALAVALGATAGVWWIALRNRAEPAPAARAPTAIRAAGLAWEGSGCSASESAASVRLDGACRARVDDLQLSIATTGETEIVRLDDGVRLARGSAEFEVVPRETKRPVRVWVSGGVIEVTGTRFLVEQRGDGGHVDLFEGTIQFRAADGTVTPVQPETRFAWTDRAAAAASPDAPAVRPDAPAASPDAPAVRPDAPPVRSDAPAVPAEPLSSAALRARDDGRDPDGRPGRTGGRASAPARRVEAPPPAASATRDASAAANRPGAAVPSEAATGLIEAVQALRAARRYREAVELLHQSHAAGWDRRTEEILSFEEGDLLEHLGEDGVSCAHWRAHQARFPGGTYSEPIRKAMARLRCP